MYDNCDRKKSISVTTSYPSASPRYVPSTAHAAIPKSELNVLDKLWGLFPNLFLELSVFSAEHCESHVRRKGDCIKLRTSAQRFVSGFCKYSPPTNK